MKDEVTVRDYIELSGGGKAVSKGEESDGKEKVYIEGFFSMYARENGKIVPGSKREGKNIWTLTGREFLARLMSYTAYAPDEAARNDRIRYIGFGVGTTPEVSSVSKLVSPISYTTSGGGLFLAELAVPTYPFQTSGSFGTAVRYTREFSETELSTAGSVLLTEAGLFTDGSPTSAPDPFEPGTRDLTLAQAQFQAPMGYKTFEAFRKTQNMIISCFYEVRF
jgi:hypothetical protein